MGMCEIKKIKSFQMIKKVLVLAFLSIIMTTSLLASAAEEMSQADLEKSDQISTSSEESVAVKKDFTKSFFASISMIIVSELGDKTFFIAAIMAMSNSRLLVFIGSIGALALMTVLSASLGHIVPALISRRVTQTLAAILFLVFGVKMLKEARELKSNAAQEEMEEVRIELEDSERSRKHDDEEAAMEPERISIGSKAYAILTNALSPVLVESFVLTFLAEWGDRSQISTIVLAASRNMWAVSLGAVIGHMLCTGFAILGGRLVASKISIKAVTLSGGILFIVFSMWTFFELYILSS